MNDEKISDTSGPIANGGPKIWQPERGYRFSIDSLILASAAGTLPGEKVLDLGTGCGIIALVMADRNPEAKFWCVEIQPELARIAALNVERNHLSHRVTVLCQDLKSLKPDQTKGPVDVVVGNPPFRERGTGRIGPDHQRTIAMHEISASLEDIVVSAHEMLKRSGRLIMVYTARRLADLIFQLKTHDLEPKWIQALQSRAGSNAKRFIIQAVKGGRTGMEILPPLILHESNGEYTDEILEMIKPRSD